MNKAEDDANGTERMEKFLQRMQPGKGPTQQLMLELAALGGLVNVIQQLMNRLANLEARVAYMYALTSLCRPSAQVLNMIKTT